MKYIVIERDYEEQMIVFPEYDTHIEVYHSIKGTGTGIVTLISAGFIMKIDSENLIFHGESISLSRLFPHNYKSRPEQDRKLYENAEHR